MRGRRLRCDCAALRVDVEDEWSKKLTEAVEGRLRFGVRRLIAAADVGRTPRVRRRRSTSRSPSLVLRLSNIGWECVTIEDVVCLLL